MQRQTAAFAVIAILIGGVAAERLSAQREAHRPQLSGTIRTYYIAADEVDWNYAPADHDHMTGKPYDERARYYTEKAPGRIGPIYRKAVYHEYTDASFTKLTPRPASWEHLGVLGPVIRAEVGDTIKVVFKNNARFPFSMASTSYERLPCWPGVLRLAGFCLAVATAVPQPAAAQSVITARPDDPAGIYLSTNATNEGDDTSTLQAAIDKAGASFSGGIVFIPSGRYRLTHTIYVWRSVRLVGYGTTRPVFVLPDGTPGFQSGVAVLVTFSGGGPGTLAPGGGRGRIPFPPPGSVPPNDRIADANQGTFYSGITNIDVEIGRGNPAAIAVRFHVAQHGILSHMGRRAIWS